MRCGGWTLLLLVVGCGSSKRDVRRFAPDAEPDADADADADAGTDAGGDGDADADADADADTICEDLVNGCGYDRGCDGEIAPDGLCECSRDRPPQDQCLPQTLQTTCDRCLSFGAVAWFCAEYEGDGWRWRRADDVQTWQTCSPDRRCERRTCHGAEGDEVWVCDGHDFVPESQAGGC